MPSPPPRRLRSALATLAVLAVALPLVVAGCASGSGGSSGPTPSSVATGAPPSAQSATPAPGEPNTVPPGETVEPGPVLDRPWATAELVDVSTGQPFRIADLVTSGTVVFVEPMAIWCTNCRAQQADAMTALSRLDRSRVVWVGLDVDPSETAEALADYGPRWGFDHTYAIAGQDVSRALVDEFGPLVISPPSTPIIVIGTDGTITLTDFGHKSVDQIVALATDHGA
jgi:hypothetical protein